MSEPIKARSALGLRAVLSGVALTLAVIGGITLLLIAPATGSSRAAYVVSALICLLVMVIAAIDLVVIWRRHRGSTEVGPGERSA